MAHYFTNDNVQSNERNITVYLDQTKFNFITDNGVFSKKGLDFGTRSLIEALPLDRIKGKVLDFGCGYGPIGIFLASKLKITVDMVDINKRSLNLALKNAKLNDVSVNVFLSDIYSNVKDKYDFIITNPPIRVGKKQLFDILLNAKEHLNKHGELWFVIHKDQGAKSTFKIIANYYEAHIVAKNKGFYIIQAIND